MVNEVIQTFQKFPGKGNSIDLPVTGQPLYDQSIIVAGWLFSEQHDPSSCRVRAWLDRTVIGETQILFVRPDVSRFLSIPLNIATGFRFLGRLIRPIDSPFQTSIQLSAAWTGDPAEYEIGSVQVHLVPSALERRDYGEVVFPGQNRVLHRSDIYGSGPPILQPMPEMLYLIGNYLAPRSSVVDVGCGAGAYGPALIEAGHQWTGLEINPHCLELLKQRNLSFRQIDWTTERFPCQDEEFDHGICIEVLEHIEKPEPFVREIARVVRKRVLFSVPNIEVLPYFKDWEVVPWHLLEGDHKNFFTRASLHDLLIQHFQRVEVFSAIEHPLRTRAEIPLQGHLCAVAEKRT